MFSWQLADTLVILSLSWIPHSCAKPCGNVPLFYLLICQDHVIDLVKTLMCGDNDWPSTTGVIFQALSAMFELSTPLLLHTLRKGILRLPPCPRESLWLVSLWDLAIFNYRKQKYHKTSNILHKLSKSWTAHAWKESSIILYIWAIYSVVSGICESTYASTGQAQRDHRIPGGAVPGILVQALSAFYVSSLTLWSLTLGGMALGHTCGSLLVACWMSHT